jgi:hypothetical protein
MKKLIAATFIALTATGVSAKDYEVSVGSYNLFEFASPVREAILPDDMRLADNPRYVNGNKGLLLNFEDYGKEFQMVISLANGKTHMVNVIPDSEIAGQTHRIGDFSAEVNRQSISNYKNPNADFLAVMSEKLSDLRANPKGFVDADHLPNPRMFRGQSKNGEVVGIVLEPVERLEGTVEGRKVFMDLFYLEVSGEVSAKDLDPSQFTEKGVGAITVTRDGRGRPYVLVVRNAA